MGSSYHRFRDSTGQLSNNPRPTRQSDCQSSGHSTQPPSSQDSAPDEELTVKEMVRQRGRAGEKLPWLDPNDGEWFGISNNGITKQMMEMFQNLLDKAYEKYPLIPQEKREQFFKCFALRFNWDPNNTEIVEIAYHKRARERYSKTLSEWKQKIKVGDCPKFRPKINDKFWEDIRKYWKTESAEIVSSRNSNNRMSERGGIGASTQNGGSISIETFRANVRKQTGEDPSLVTILEKYHTNKKTKVIQDPRAAQYINKIKEIANIQLSQLSTDGSVDSNELTTAEMEKIVEETIPVTKGRRYGSGKPSNIHASSTSTSSQKRTEVMQKEIENLRETLLEKDDNIKSLTNDVDELKDQAKGMLAILQLKFPLEFKNLITGKS